MLQMLLLHISSQLHTGCVKLPRWEHLHHDNRQMLQTAPPSPQPVVWHLPAPLIDDGCLSAPLSDGELPGQRGSPIRTQVANTRPMG